MSNIAYGIDLGTNNIKIFSRNNDKILVEKNIIAIEGRSNLFAYGDSAFEMYEKAPENIHITFPLTNGVIADIKSMQTLLKYFIKDTQKGRVTPSDYYIAVPTDITEVEKRAFYDLVKDAGVKSKRVMMVEKAIADGLGLGIDVKTSQGVLLVDVGYETTEISVLSLGGIVVSKLIKTGGLKFDDAIRKMVREEFGLVIGQKTAEGVKINLSSLIEKSEEAVVYGRDIVSGLPIERKIPTDKVNKCLVELFMSIIEYIKAILERTPPELSADIYRHGIYLTGGASQVSGFYDLVSVETKLKVNLPEDPVISVAAGLSRVIKEQNYRSVAYEMEAMAVRL